MEPPPEPPVVLVPGFLGSHRHWHLDRVQRRHPRARFIVVGPGPASSHHDRACEIFYSLKGGLVDYGAAHSAAFGHARFGRSHAALLPRWDAARPIDLVGHSIGGMTARVLQALLAIGKLTGRRVILPRMLCYCDFLWKEMKHCRVGGAALSSASTTDGWGPDDLLMTS